MKTAPGGEQEKVADLHHEGREVVPLLDGVEVVLESVRQLRHVGCVGTSAVDKQLTAGLRCAERDNKADKRRRVELRCEVLVQCERIVIVVMDADLLSVDKPANRIRDERAAIGIRRDRGRSAARTLAQHFLKFTRGVEARLEDATGIRLMASRTLEIRVD